MFAFFALAVTGLWVNMDQLWLLARRLGVGGLVSALFGTALCAAVGGPLIDYAGRMLAGLAPRLDRPGVSGVIARNLVVASEVLLILAVGSFFHRAPEFVYKAF
jgi:hypothetical protein